MAYPVFSWSKSRNHVFQECKRKYFYQYYGSHQGWLKKATDETKLVYRLKQMENIYSLFGTILHDELGDSLKKWRKSKRFSSQAELLERILTRLDLAIFQSNDREAWENRPKHHAMLSEIYYADPGFEEKKREIFERASQSISHFYNSRTLFDLLSSDDIKLIEVDDSSSKPIPSLIGGEKVYAKPDLVYKKHYTWTIVDWKTGKEREDDIEQLLIYSLYLKGRYKVRHHQIQLRDEYLLTSRHQHSKLSDFQSDMILERIRESVRDMKHYLVDREKNIPKPMEQFERREDKSSCWSCNFREVCQKR